MKRPANRWIFLVVVISVLLAKSTLADTLQTTEYRITASTAHETTPTLGNDGTTDLVVFTLQPVLAGGVFGPGDIWYHDLAAYSSGCDAEGLR